MLQVCLDICGDIPGREEGRSRVAARVRLRLQVLLSRLGRPQEQLREARRLDGRRVLRLRGTLSCPEPQ